MGIAGVDEAGRGPVLGPLVLAGVIIAEENLKELVDKGLTDSKLMTKKKREELFQEINDFAQDKQIIIIPPKMIDNNKQNGINLNQTEIEAIISILQSIENWSTAYVDACEKNTQKMGAIIMAQVKGKVIAEHYADLKYPIVSAASVIAKVTRDREIEKAHKKYGIDFGSGYPNDPKTIQFLEEYYQKHKKFPEIARNSWETCKKIIRDCEQTELKSYFKKS